MTEPVHARRGSLSISDGRKIWGMIGHETPEHEFSKNFWFALVCRFYDISAERTSSRARQCYLIPIRYSAHSEAPFFFSPYGGQPCIQKKNQFSRGNTSQNHQFSDGSTSPGASQVWHEHPDRACEPFLRSVRVPNLDVVAGSLLCQLSVAWAFAPNPSDPLPGINPLFLDRFAVATI